MIPPIASKTIKNHSFFRHLPRLAPYGFPNSPDRRKDFYSTRPRSTSPPDIAPQTDL